jgi:hypothetical protein
MCFNDNWVQILIKERSISISTIDKLNRILEHVMEVMEVFNVEKKKRIICAIFALIN